MKTPILFLTLGLAGCATMERMGTPDNYAKCAAADVATTAAFLTKPGMHELNPLVRALKVSALGHIGSVVAPAIGVSMLAYYALKWLDKPAVTATAAALTCASAARNLYLIR